MSEKNVTPYEHNRIFLDKKMSVAVYVVVLIAAVFFRTIQLANNMDFLSGKYINGGFWKYITFVVLVIGILLLSAVVIFGESRDKAIDSCILQNPVNIKWDKLNSKITPQTSVGMFVMAVLFAFEVIQDLIRIGSANLAISTEDDPVFVFAGISAFSWVCYGLMLLLVVTFISTGVNILKQQGITRGNCFFMTAFPILKLLEIFNMILNQQLINPQSEKCLILFTDITSAIFFLCLIRVFCGFEQKHTRLKMMIFGYTASILAAVSTVPRYIMFFTKNYSLREGMLEPDTIDIGIILVTVMVLAVFWSNYDYRVMPKLNVPGQNRWKGVQLDTKGNEDMESLDEE